MKKTVAGLLCASFLSACGYVDSKQVARGEFRGDVSLVWVHGGDTSKFGDGVFIYLPVPGRRLEFFRGESAWVSDGSQHIVPQAFYTDGGSVPRILQAANGFNAWAYGPAYVIHDWVFVARKCLTDLENGDVQIEDQDFLAEIKKIENMSFQESAYVMAETIETVVGDKLADTNRSRLVSQATAGPISHALWKEKRACEKNMVPQEKVDELLNARVRAAFSSRNKSAGSPRTVTTEISGGLKVTFFDLGG